MTRGMNHKILVIDDSEIARDWRRFALEDAGIGRSEEELADLALACDADGFLSKVSGGDALVERIDEIRSMILW